MPELPEVEAVCRKLRKTATGARIAAARVQRPRITGKQDPAETEALATGRVIEKIGRRSSFEYAGIRVERTRAWKISHPH